MRPVPAASRGVQTRSIDVRRRILDAAVEVLGEHGYAGATTLRIQERAGISRGRLLHHYPSRDALLIAASHELASRRIAELSSTVTWPEELGARIDAAVDTMATCFLQGGYFWAATELWLASRNHAELRAQLAPLERDLGREIRRATDGYFGPELASHPGFHDLRQVIFTSLRGMALSRAFDPREEPVQRHLARLKRLARRVLLDDDSDDRHDHQE
jgi:AcrR family transcriptional regulator